MSVAVEPAGYDNVFSNYSADAGQDQMSPQASQMLAQIEDMLNQLMQELAANWKGGVTQSGGVSSASTASFDDLSLADFQAQSPATPSAQPPAQSPVTPPVTATSEKSTTSGSSGSAPGVTDNAGGVPQASAVSGVNPNSVKVVDTGTGNDKTFNVTNDTNHTESFTYSVQGVNKGTITLQPGQTGTFVASSADIGVRISPSDAQGNTHPNEVLYEDGGAANGQAAGEGNPDISKVDGDKDYDGNDMDMTVTLSDGRKAGDGDQITPYMYPTDDAAAMGLAGDSSKTVNIVMSDTGQST
ncbi:hypothetical protein [Paraburkholderia phosphatilytica]|uniref:hypothetical protein n=1 Tax=Paraburkholderia phosphatilytica TaxID=2282883 RepID=UPI000F5D6350|nr:hypothetical protein [Paraburkholderia phosphatilytica]